MRRHLLMLPAQVRRELAAQAGATNRLASLEARLVAAEASAAAAGGWQGSKPDNVVGSRLRCQLCSSGKCAVDTLKVWKTVTSKEDNPRSRCAQPLCGTMSMFHDYTSDLPAAAHAAAHPAAAGAREAAAGVAAIRGGLLQEVRGGQEMVGSVLRGELARGLAALAAEEAGAAARLDARLAVRAARGGGGQEEGTG